jgi:hypothetical protein
MVSDKVFNTDGTQKIFSSDFDIISEDHLRVYLGAAVVSRDDYDLINNAAVFNVAPTTGQVMTVQVGTTPADILVSPTDAGIVAANIADINALEDILGDIVSVSTNNADVTTVATNIADVNTTATNIANVNTVAGDTIAINAVNANATNINAVAADASDIGIVATNIADVTAVADNETNIDAAVANATNINAAVANATNINSAVSNATNINAAVANETNINAVVTNETNINSAVANEADIDTVAANIANVNTVAGNTTNINAVNANSTNINAAVANETNINAAVANEADIDTVAASIASVNTTATNIASVNTTATNIASVNTVAGNTANVNTVAGIDANVTTVAGISADVTAAATNAADITAVATEVAKVVEVANDLQEAISEIDTVATSIANVNLVGGSITNVNEVATNIGSVNAFGEQYRVSATEPTTSLDAGDLWFDTTAGTMKVYTGAGFANAGSSVNGIENSVEYIATAGQTSFAVVYDAGYLNVFLNGVKLDSTDYTATDGANVVLDTGATVGDSVFIQSFGTFELADHYSKVDADARYAQTVNHYTKTEGDARFEPIDATIVKDADIGVTVQGYSAVLGATTASFLTADETKLDGIEALADVTDTTNVTAAGAAMLTGATFTGDVTATDFSGPLNGAIQFTAKNTSGGTLTVGQVVYISGISGNTPTVELADADDAAKMPAYGLVAVAAADNDPVEITTFGPLTNVKTDYAGWQVGDTLYVSTTPGTLTNVAPTGEGTLLQNLGRIRRVQQSAGSITVGGAGRTNATPNLNDGNVFIGNASNQAAARALVIGDTTGLQTALDNINTDLVNDTTPQLGGDLDLNGHVITGLSTDPTMGGDLSGTASNAQIGANTVTDTELNSAKLNGIATGATNVTNNNQISNGAGYVTTSGANTSLSNLSATGEQRLCHAWVSWVGTGTVTIRDSYNVSSISDRGTGQYTVNLTTAMPNANYAPLVTGMKGSTDDGYMMTDIGTGGYTASTIQVTGRIGSSGPDDLPVLIVAVFGD